MTIYEFQESYPSSTLGYDVIVKVTLHDHSTFNDHCSEVVEFSFFPEEGRSETQDFRDYVSRNENKLINWALESEPINL